MCACIYDIYIYTHITIETYIYIYIWWLASPEMLVEYCWNSPAWNLEFDETVSLCVLCSYIYIYIYIYEYEYTEARDMPFWTRHISMRFPAVFHQPLIATCLRIHIRLRSRPKLTSRRCSLRRLPHSRPRAQSVPGVARSGNRRQAEAPGSHLQGPRCL